MQNYLKSLLCALIIITSFSACRTHTIMIVKKPAHHMPPGHAKKVYGHKSAKQHAPGQKKKH